MDIEELPLVLQTTSCIVAGCNVQLKFGTGSTCVDHKEEGDALISAFETGVPSYSNELQPN